MTEQTQATATQGLGSIIMNVFSSPGEAFSGLKESESRPTLWVLPLITLLIIVIASTFVIFSNDALKNQIMDAQVQALQKQVAEQKMTQERADQAREGMEKMGSMLMVIGIVVGVIMVSLMFFGASLVLWLIDKLALKSTAGYGKHLEMYGIANWIGVLGGIVSLLMIMGLNTLYASPSAAMAVYASYDPMNTTHKILTTINIFAIWQAIVIGFGISKLSDKPSSTGITIALVLWVIWAGIQIGLGFAR